MQNQTSQTTVMEGNINGWLTGTESTSELFICTLGFLSLFTCVIPRELCKSNEVSLSLYRGN